MKQLFILIIISLLIFGFGGCQTVGIPTHVIHGKLLNLTDNYLSVELDNGEVEHYRIVSWLGTGNLDVGSEYYFTYSSGHRAIISYEADK